MARSQVHFIFLVTQKDYICQLSLQWAENMCLSSSQRKMGVNGIQATSGPISSNTIFDFPAIFFSVAILEDTISNDELQYGRIIDR